VECPVLGLGGGSGTIRDSEGVVEGVHEGAVEGVVEGVVEAVACSAPLVAEAPRWVRDTSRCANGAGIGALRASGQSRGTLYMGGAVVAEGPEFSASSWWQRFGGACAPRARQKKKSPEWGL
jgi:hypothetical protein